MKTFRERFGGMFTGILSGFDRLRLRGTRRLLAHVTGLKHFLWRSQVHLKEFDSYVQDLTGTLCRSVEQEAKDKGRPLTYLYSGDTDKGKLVEEVMARDGIRDGLIGVWSCVEPCSSYVIFRNKETHKLELRQRLRKCLHYYHYYQHPQFGLLHTRLQTWLPFTMQICLNGREWLARQMDAAGIGYVRRDNCFVAVDDIDAAQTLMDKQLHSNWPELLEGLASLSDPTHATLLGEVPAPYYWTVDQSEWATDIMFRSAADLAALYPRLLRHGIDTLHSEDVMRFLGRRLTPTGKIHGSFKDQVTTDFQRRPEGTRLKHRLGANSLKITTRLTIRAGPCCAWKRLITTCTASRSIALKKVSPRVPSTGCPCARGSRI
jgi:hypothetical protein